MDNVRLLLWLVFIGSIWISYSTWVQENAPPPTPDPIESVVDTEVPAGEDSLPDIDTSLPDETSLPPVLDRPDPEATLATIHVRTDVLDAEIALTGGDLVRADLLEYPVDKSDPDRVVRLLDYAAGQRWVFQTGLRTAGGGPEPTHLAPFTSAQSSYVLTDGQDALEVRLNWAEAGPVAVTKVFTFRRSSYRVDLSLEVTNNGNTVWNGVPYAQMVRLHNPLKRTYLSVDSYSFTGPVLYDGDSYEKLDFDELAEQGVTQTVTNGWLAGIQHHFLAGAAPPANEPTTFEATTLGREYLLRAVSPARMVEPGASEAVPIRLFVGPKLQDQLAATAEGFDLTVDYGVLTVLAKPLFWVLDHVHSWVGNWGWSIIIVTFLIKLVFYRLTAASGRSMAKMRKLAPRLKALQERFKDDRAKLNQAMMELYKNEKVNPAAGCLPILIQMPFFFAFYWVLVESVEMRQAPFMLWINDLSVRDPFFVLPILMGAAMLLQMRLNPAPPDPVQARVMQILPLVFTAMFAFFPAGLVLYWLTNTVVSIAQQWRINTLVQREA